MDLQDKIVQGLERLSDVVKTMLLLSAKENGISPIQIQILIYVSNHKNNCTVSDLASEYNLTKATISDAVRVLLLKELLIKDHSSADKRSYSLMLSKKGEQIVEQINDYANPLKNQLAKLDPLKQENLYGALTDLIYKLNQSGVISVQRTCRGCRFYCINSNVHHCNLLNKDLLEQDIRLDCPEFESMV